MRMCSIAMIVPILKLGDSVMIDHSLAKLYASIHEMS